MMMVCALLSSPTTSMCLSRRLPSLQEPFSSTYQIIIVFPSSTAPKGCHMAASSPTFHNRYKLINRCCCKDFHHFFLLTIIILIIICWAIQELVAAAAASEIFPTGHVSSKSFKKLEQFLVRTLPFCVKAKDSLIKVIAHHCTKPNQFPFRKNVRAEGFLMVWLELV